MDTRSEIAWLARRAGWGLAPGELDDLTAQGTTSVLDGMTSPDLNGVTASVSPWADFVFIRDPDNAGEQGLEALSLWLENLATTQRPFEDALSWFWHDHFAVSASVVKDLHTMIQHLDLLRTESMGNFREMVRKVTVDAAMLVFLDGATSTGASPNENYGRELQELYTLGIGNYTEQDVRAAAIALTGYVVRRRDGWKVQFVRNRHDDTPQTFLGVSGVHDVDTVVDAALDHPAVPGFIAAKMARFFLGDVSSAVIDDLAALFSAESLEIRPLARAILEAGVAGESSPVVLAPLPWLVQAVKATGADIEPQLAVTILRHMGQMPGQPPNVAGYPGAAAWLSSSTTALRFSASGVLAGRTPEGAPTLQAAAESRWDDLADLLVRPEGFSQSTIDALSDLSQSAGLRPGESHLALALASPDLLIA